MRRRRRRPQGAPTIGANDHPLVTVLCVSNRPKQLDHVLSTFQAQDWQNKELVLVQNTKGFDDLPSDWNHPTQILSQPPSISLGQCLNVGRAAADGTILCRFDDDDLYDPGYLSATIDVFRTVDAQVVGKSAHYVELSELGETILRFPSKANCYVGYVAGGTIAEYIPASGSIAYPDVSLGEDSSFTRACERNGLRVWSTSPKGFTQVRRHHTDHTWQVTAEDLKRG